MSPPSFTKSSSTGSLGSGAAASPVEMACWDLAGKAWGVPVWQMLGGKFRDKILLYADTTSSSNAEEMAKHLQERLPSSAGGFKFLKMDLSVGSIAGEGNIVRPAPASATGLPGMPRTPHQFTGGHITEKGLKLLEDYCTAVRERVGWNIPIATDHYGDR